MNSSSVVRSKARKLRRNGQSFRHIAKELNTSVSTAHLWSRDIQLTPKQVESLKLHQQTSFQLGRTIASKFKKQKRIASENQTKKNAQEEFRKRKTDPFFMLGVSLYWAEGFKKDHSLGFVNSDLQMAKIFIRWLTEYCKVSPHNIRSRIQINQVYQPKIDEIQKYWSAHLRIPDTQFQKPFFQKSKNVSMIDPTYRGQIRIRAIGARKSFLQILTWIEELKKDYSVNWYRDNASISREKSIV